MGVWSLASERPSKFSSRLQHVRLAIAMNAYVELVKLYATSPYLQSRCSSIFFRVSCVDSLAIIRSAAHSVRRICNASHRANVTAGLPVKVARVCLLGRNDPLLLAPVLCFKVRGWWTGLETGTGPWQKRACARADSEDRLLPPETLRHVFAFTVTPVYKSAPIYRITPSPPPLLIIFSLTAFDSDRTGPKWRRGSSYSRFCLNLIITF